MCVILNIIFAYLNLNLVIVFSKSPKSILRRAICVQLPDTIEKKGEKL